MRNLAASVKQRLLDRSKATGQDYLTLLQRYAAEGFLLRLSSSPYREHFVLKGAMLFATWGLSHRPTRDLDFAAIGIPLGSLGEALGAVCLHPDVQDGLIFDASSLVLEQIRIGERYEGVRGKITALLERTRIRVQIDLVPGDAIYPPPRDLEFPTLLGHATPVVRACEVETAAAEKLHAMVLHGETNSRLKDFFDVRAISQHFEISGATLSAAIMSTFSRRETPISEEPFALMGNSTKSRLDPRCGEASWQQRP